MRRSQYSLIFLCVLALGLAVLLIQRSVGNDKNPEDAVAQLKQLQDKVVKLEARIATLEKRPAYLTSPETHRRSTPDQTIPKDWHEQKFNGMKYYIVPVETKR
jgi:hypothetical protein